MSDEDRVEFERMKQELAELRRLFVVTPTMVRITKSLQTDGTINADRVYTARSGSYVELTT